MWLMGELADVETFLLGRGHIWQEKRKSLLGFWGPMRVRNVKTALEI